MRKIGKIFFVFVLVLSGCNAKNKMENSDKKNVCDVDCIPSDMKEYEDLKGVEHVFLDTTYEQAIQKLEKDTFTGILYFGFPKCPWCEEAILLMNNSAKEKDLNIYYVNKRSEDSLAHPELEQKLIEILDEAYGLEKDDEGKLRLYVPEVVVVQKGKVVAHHMGTVDGHDANERKMNEDEKDLLESIYNKMFKKIKK